MKFIELTSVNAGKIFINVELIGHFYDVDEKENRYSVRKPKHTRIGVVTHNNGGFEVIETIDEILQKIKLL